jgi:hypothetical protein
MRRAGEEGATQEGTGQESGVKNDEFDRPVLSKGGYGAGDQMGRRKMFHLVS